MNKHIFRILCLAWGLFLAFPGYASASEIKWNLVWADDGRLLETVQVPKNVSQTQPTTNWQIAEEGDLIVYNREIPDWQTYQTQKDGLPIIVRQNNYYYYQQTSIQTDPQKTAAWFSQLTQGNGWELTLVVPGLIFGSSADEQAPPTAVWHFSQGNELFHKIQLMNVVHIDGLLMGITIVGLGLVIGGTIFLRRLGKVDEIIAEEYGLPKHKNSPPDEE